MRDDRGNRRDHERYDRMNGDRANSPSRERQSKALEMGNHDETMQDTFAGPGVPPFSSDIPPPVLMPVPGAGSVASSNYPSHNLMYIFYFFRFGE